MNGFYHGGNVYEHPGCIDFSASLSPLGLPSDVREALLRHLDDLAHYPDPKSTALCAAIADAEGVDPRHVLACAGATDAFGRIACVLAPRTVLLPAPTYAGYRQALLASPATIRTHRLDAASDFEFTDAFAADAASSDLAFVCNPNNPSGRCVDRDVLRHILDACEKAGTWVVLDETFIELTDRPSSTDLVERYGHLVLVKALTKSHALAGLRVGYVMARDEMLLERLAQSGAPWAVSVAAQVAGVAALRQKGYLERARAVVSAERSFLSDALSSLGQHVVQSDANFLLFRARPALFEALVAHGILIRPCDDFAGLGPDWYRIAVRTRAENERMVHALEEVL